MSCGRKPRPDKPQQDANAEYGQAFVQRQCDNRDATLVQASQPRHWLFEQEQTVLHEPQRQSPAEQAVPETRPQKRPAHECITRADQLRDLYFLAAVLDIEPNRVADNDDNGDAEQ